MLKIQEIFVQIASSTFRRLKFIVLFSLRTRDISCSMKKKKVTVNLLNLFFNNDFLKLHHRKTFSRSWLWCILWKKKSKSQLYQQSNKSSPSWNVVPSNTGGVKQHSSWEFVILLFFTLQKMRQKLRAVKSVSILN